MSASDVIPVYGSPTTLNCTGGTAAGSTNGVTGAAIAFTAMNLVCHSFSAATSVAVVSPSG